MLEASLARFLTKKHFRSRCWRSSYGFEISAFMLVGACHPEATVGIVEKEYRSEVSSLIAELVSAAAAEKGIIFEEAMEDRLCAYSRAVVHFPTAIKEFKWRNGWFYSISEKAIAEGKPDPCPLHTAWLEELKVV